MSIGPAADEHDLVSRVRTLEATTQRFLMLFDSDAGEGLLSSMKNALVVKIDGYAAQVNSFISGEPARKQHIENNAKQAVMDAKYVAELALKTAEDKQMRLHEENRKDRENDRAEICALREKSAKHETFVQRAVGILIAGQVFIILCGFFMTVLTFAGGFAWWLIIHSQQLPR